MSNTIGGALRTVIVDDGRFGERVWADRGPKQVSTWPYVTFQDGIDAAPALQGDAAVSMLERFVQIDLWEKAAEEDEAHGRALYGLLNGARITLGDAHVCRVKVAGAVRIFEPDTYIVHRAFTLSVKHDPSAF